jgi:hypothetical protein
MKRIVNLTSLFTVMALFFSLAAADTFAQKKKATYKKKTTTTYKKKVVPAEPVYTVAMGTVVRTRMNDTISSKTARVGDTFNVTITEPVYSSNGVVVVPVGSTLRGRVNAVKAAAKGGKPGEIDASFNQLRLPNGRVRAINGTLTELSGKTSSDNEGTASGKKMENRKLIFIGGGTAGGAILGAAIGGGKGALIGGLLGAGGGFLGEKYTKGPEAEVKSGTEFGVYLNQAIALPKFKEVSTPENP